MLSIRDLNIIYSNKVMDCEFVFIICQRNANRFIDKCLDSIISQTYSNWGIVIFDDCSNDDTENRIWKKIVNISNPVVFVQNNERYGKLRNFFYGIRFCCINPESVIIDVDGDDWLAHKHVLHTIKQEYDNGAEQTIGQCQFYPDKPIYTRVNLEDSRSKLPDSHNWLHPRTFKKGLFDLIGIECFTSNNHWFVQATDWSYVPFLIEMSSKTVKIDEVLYIYNIEGSQHFIPVDEPNKVFDHLKIKDFITDRIPKFPKLKKLQQHPIGEIYES